MKTNRIPTSAAHPIVATGPQTGFASFVAAFSASVIRFVTLP
jgi:hypothetical protein